MTATPSENIQLLSRHHGRNAQDVDATVTAGKDAIQ